MMATVFQIKLFFRILWQLLLHFLDLNYIESASHNFLKYILKYTFQIRIKFSNKIFKIIFLKYIIYILKQVFLEQNF